MRPIPSTPLHVFAVLPHVWHELLGSGQLCGLSSQRQLAVRARELVNTPEFARAQRQRKKVEALFAELKNQIGLRRLRLRRLKFVREQFFLAAVAQNIKRLVRFLSRPITPTTEAAA